MFIFQRYISMSLYLIVTNLYVVTAFNSTMTGNTTRGLIRRGIQEACGNGNVGNGFCGDGSCCSQFGWCGTSSEHCGGTVAPPPIPEACGNGNVGNGFCGDGSCCSQFGWCGTSPEHCGGTVAPPPIPEACGNGIVGNGFCGDGSCCSQFGWCGTSPEFCGGTVAPPPVAPTTPLSDFCNGDGGACGCGVGGDGNRITLNRFWGDSTHEAVWRCGGAFRLEGATLDQQWGGTLTAAGPEAEVSTAIGLTFNQGDSFDGWEGCCFICGANLQIAGKISSGWYCEKDFFSTGIWLKGVN